MLVDYLSKIDTAARRAAASLADRTVHEPPTSRLLG